MSTVSVITLMISMANNSAISENMDKEIIAEIRETFDDASYAIDQYGAPDFDQSGWNAVSDLKEFSKKYPELLFIVWGSDETEDGYEKAYIINGKSQEVQGEIVYDAFDPAKLE